MSLETVIDLAWLESATLNDLKAAMRNPSQLAAVNALLQTPEGKEIASQMLNDPDYVPKQRQAMPSAEEAAQIAADTALAEQQAAEAAAAEATAATSTPIPVEAPTSVVEEKKRIVIDYQVTAEDGTTPIGRKTHFEGTTDEIIEKLKNAHINAVRYAERIKNSRIRSVELQTQHNLAQQQLQKDEDEAKAAVEAAANEKDPAKLREAISKVSKVEKSAEDLAQEQRKKGAEIGELWMADHKDDFLPCKANSNIIGGWLKENNLELSYENLELAFKATETRLAKPVHQAPIEEVPAPVAPNAPAAAPAASAAVTPSIPAPAASAAEPASTPAPSASQPTLAAPAPTSAAAANTASAARRPGVNGGIAPGSLSAQRPSEQQQPKMTTRAELLKDIKKMSSEEYRKKLKSPEYVAKLRAAGIPVSSNVA